MNLDLARLLDAGSWALQSPVLWLAATLAAFQAGVLLNRGAKGHALVNPVLIAMLILIGALLASGVDYATYMKGGQYVNLLLGPATVALAIPLHANFHHVRKAALPIAAGLLAGSLAASGGGAGIATLFGADLPLAKTLAVKSITAPIAIGTAEQIGGIAPLAAVFAVITGVVGTVLFTGVLRTLRVTDWRAIGLAAGLTAHGQGTARALALNETAGAFSGLAMGLNAMLTAIWLPIAVKLIAG